MSSTGLVPLRLRRLDVNIDSKSLNNTHLNIIRTLRTSSIKMWKDNAKTKAGSESLFKKLNII